MNTSKKEVLPPICSTDLEMEKKKFENGGNSQKLLNFFHSFRHGRDRCLSEHGWQ
jgi:hypothetical protein